MERPLTRRDLLLGGTGTMVLAGVPPTAALATEHDHEHAAPAGARSGLLAAASACVAEGEACLAHCLQLFATGDTSLAACAKLVSEMIPVCRAVAALAAQDAKRLTQLLGPCIEVCADCEKECRKHADKHAICKSCADACERLIAEAKKLKTA